jgi:hypothetical protein
MHGRLTNLFEPSFKDDSTEFSVSFVAPAQIGVQTFSRRVDVVLGFPVAASH